MTYSRDSVVVVFKGGKWKKATVFIGNKEKHYKALFCLEIIENLREDEEIGAHFQEVWNHIRW